VKSVRVMGRNTQGVRLINLREGAKIAAATQVPSDNGAEQAAEAEMSPEDTAPGGLNEGSGEEQGQQGEQDSPEDTVE